MHYVKAKSILTSWNAVNIYRGCTHGCIYCDSRSSCYQNNLIFEDIEVKENAISLLDEVLGKKRKKLMISTGSMSDPYMPLEDKLGFTKKFLEVILKHGFGGTVITKSDLILRDLELIEKINNKSKFVVQMTLTTYDDELCKILEPNVCPTSKRVEVLKTMQEIGIPTIVWLTPLLPFINDTKENIEGILKFCGAAKVKGIITYGMSLTLRKGNREYFYKMLDEKFPGLKEKYIALYGNSYEIKSPNHQELLSYFHKRCEELGIMHSDQECLDYINAMPIEYEQMSIF